MPMEARRAQTALRPAAAGAGGLLQRPFRPEALHVARQPESQGREVRAGEGPPLAALALRVLL